MKRANELKAVSVAIEGVCCSGKTSLISALENMPDTYVISEAPTLLTVFPPPPESVFQARLCDKFYLETEALRSLLQQLYGSSANYVFLDRSFLSVLAVSYGYLSQYGPQVYLDLLDDCIHFIETGYLVPPDMCFYLSVSHTLILERNQTRKNSLCDFWVGEEVIHRQQSFYQRWEQAMQSANFYRIDGSASKKQIITQVSTILEQSPKRVDALDYLAAIQQFKRRESVLLRQENLEF